VDCGTHITTQWIDCKDESGNEFYRPCYAKNRLDVAAAAGTTCVKCRTDAASGHWYGWKDKPGTKLCSSCYVKNRTNKKAAKANDK
jgi:hypothetical protein